MKRLSLLSALGVSAAVLLGNTSCVSIDYSSFSGSGGGYYGGPPSSGSAYRAPVGISHFGGYSGYGYGHGGGYRDDGQCKEERIKLTGGSQKGKGTRPKEYHTREWFEKRGYDLDNYKHKHEHSGKTHRGKNY